MNRSYFIAALLVAIVLAAPVARAAAPTTAPAEPKLSGKLGTPVQLFNGKNFEGWTWHTQAQTGVGSKLEDIWTIVDGAMHCKGRQTGYIRTDTAYENFVYTVEQRHIARGNGGLFVTITGDDKVWPANVQIQGQFGDVGDIVITGGLKMTSDPARTTVRAADVRIAKIGPASEKPMGEWNVVETFCDHHTIWVKVNGVLQNVATDVESLKGKVGIQFEGTEMEFRKVQLTPIE